MIYNVFNIRFHVAVVSRYIVSFGEGDQMLAKTLEHAAYFC